MASSAGVAPDLGKPHIPSAGKDSICTWCQYRKIVCYGPKKPPFVGREDKLISLLWTCSKLWTKFHDETATSTPSSSTFDQTFWQSPLQLSIGIYHTHLDQIPLKHRQTRGSNSKTCKTIILPTTGFLKMHINIVLNVSEDTNNLYITLFITLIADCNYCLSLCIKFSSLVLCSSNKRDYNF